MSWWAAREVWVVVVVVVSVLLAQQHNPICHHMHSLLCAMHPAMLANDCVGLDCSC